MAVSATYPVQSEKELFMRLGYFNICFLGAFLVLFLVVTVATYFRAEAFESEGIEVVATIEARTVERGARNPNGGPRVERLLTMAYTTQAGEDLRVVRDVGRAYYNAHRVGDEVTIRYLPDDPDTFEYNLGSNARAIGWFAAICAGLLAGMSFLAWQSYGHAKRAVAARREGTVETVEVTGFEESIFKAGWKDGFHMTWVDAAGEAGRSLKRPREDYGQIMPGDRVTLYRSADGVWWDGDVGTR